MENLKIIALASLKGGCGKTTVSINLAAAAIEAGVKTLLLDFDPQKSAEDQYNIRRANAGISDDPQTLSCKYDSVDDIIKMAVNHGYELLVFDLPPNLEQSNRHLIAIASYLLFPTQPTQLDLSSVAHSIQMAKDLDKRGAAVLTRTKSRAKANEQAKDFITESLGFDLAPTPIVERVFTAEAMKKGGNVIGLKPNDPSSEDFRNLWNFVSKAVYGQAITKTEAA